MREKRRRIWSEFLPASELASPATRALLRRFDLEPVVAVLPGAENGELADALRALSSDGIRVGLWPLLPDAEGYWANDCNADAFCRRVEEVLRFADTEGVRVGTLAIDLEPPFGQFHGFWRGRASDRIRALFEAGLRVAGRGRGRRRLARARFARLAADLRERGVESLAPVPAPVVLDLLFGVRVWQRVLFTPVDGCGWSVVSPMTYSSILAGRYPGLDGVRASRLIHRAGRALTRAKGAARTSLSIGLVSTGKLGNEPTYASPDDLRRDVEAARTAGVDDLALFSLEGVLRRGRPEDWLEPFVQ